MKHLRKQHRRNQGTVIIIAVVLVFACTMAITGWTYLTAARMRQSEAVGNACQRHIVWQNTRALNQQNTLVNAFSNNATQGGLTTNLSQATGWDGMVGWGGLDTNSYSNLNVFTSTNRATGNIYPFHNIRPTPTTDGDMFFTTIESTFSDSDASQTEHYFLYNYEKSYPGSLMGDLFIIHTKPSGTAGSYIIGDNFLINGNVMVYDGTAVTNTMRATMCHNCLGTTNTTLSSAGSALLMPDNYPAIPVGHVGNGGAGGALLADGTLNMINNSYFPASSLYATMVASSSGYTTCSSTTAATLATGVVVTNHSLPYTVPVTSPYGYTASASKSVLTITLLTVTSHVYITGAYDQIVINGSANATDYATQDTLAPLIIMLSNSSARDIRFVGENNRRLILATGTGNGATVFMSFSGTTSVAGGGPLRWRLQHINEYRNPWYDVPATPTGISLLLTGGIRTNWSVNCTDTTANARISLNLESNSTGSNGPGLELLMPRDAWNEPYFYIR